MNRLEIMKSLTEKRSRILKAIAFTLILLASGSSASGAVTGRGADPSTVYFRVYDNENGLPDNSINAICEDKFGYIWIGTWNGVCRFDGKDIRCYSSGSGGDGVKKGTAPVNDMVRTLCASDEGVWVGTDSGISLFRYSDGRFHHGKYQEYSPKTREQMTGLLRNRVSRVISNDGNVICLTGEGGLLYLEEMTEDGDPVFKYRRIPGKRRYGDITMFRDGNFLALSNEGITVFSPDGKVEICHNTFPQGFDPNMNIYYDPITKRVITGSGIGHPSHAFKVVDHKGKLVGDTDFPQIQGLMGAARSGNLTVLASDGEGLYVVEDNGSVRHYTPRNSDINTDALYSVFCDRSGNIWCGSYRHGMTLLSPELNTYTMLDPKNGSISYDIVTSVVPDGNRLFVGLDGGGVDIYDSTTGKSRNFNSTNSGLAGNNVVSMIKDGGKLWIGVYTKGIAQMDISSGSISSKEVPGEPGQKIWTMIDDRNGKIWIGGVNISILDKTNGNFDTPHDLKNLNVQSLSITGNHIWAATRNSGLIKIDRASHRILARYSDSPSSNACALGSAIITFAACDSHGHVWFTCNGEELQRLDPNDNTVETFGSHSGMAQKNIYSMAEGHNGVLWFGSQEGLFRYDPKSSTFALVRDSRLLTTYTYNSAISDGDIIYFGTTKGILAIPQDHALRDRYNNPLSFSSLSPLQSPESEIPLFSMDGKEVSLPYRNNSFTVEFSVPEMLNTNQIRYEYRLEGLEDVWRSSGASNSATYTNVPPGKYTLLVRHTLPDGKWSTPSTLIIRIGHPWYGTVWARILWALIIIGIFGGGSAAYRRHQEKIAEEKMKEMKIENERELNEAKLDFYSNITHELRTPCFLISAQLEEMIDSDKGPANISSLNGIYRNALKLNRLINQIINFRKLDSGNIKLYRRPVELVKFFSELTPDYEHLCSLKHIEFRYLHNDAPIEARIDPDKLELIVTNLISNAYKYTQEGGHVTLEILDIGETVRIFVKDDGIGIIDSNRNAIFKKYFRTERGQRQSNGDGIGLYFVKRLVGLHGGTIRVNSELNKGSEFIVNIPKDGDAAEISLPFPESSNPTLSKRFPVTHSTPEPIKNPTATRTMLIVDDDPEVLDLLIRNLDQEYIVSYVTNGSDGLELAQKEPFDVVVTDLMIPELDGYELIGAIRDNSCCKDSKIVVLSALGSEDDILRAYDAGADCFIQKPTSLKVLRKQIDLLFEKDDIRVGAPVGKEDTPATTYTKVEQKFLLKCRSLIDENITREDFGIEFMLKELAMSHSTLYKKIKKLTGLSLVDFINEYRIGMAIRMFRNGHTNVQSVAEQCGYRDIKTFREAFKRKTGKAPKQYIQSLG